MKILRILFLIPLFGEVFDNVEHLRELHPAYGSLTKEDMTEAMYRMIHRGALYYS